MLSRTWRSPSGTLPWSIRRCRILEDLCRIKEAARAVGLAIHRSPRWSRCLCSLWWRGCVEAIARATDYEQARFEKTRLPSLALLVVLSFTSSACIGTLRSRLIAVAQHLRHRAKPRLRRRDGALRIPRNSPRRFGPHRPHSACAPSGLRRVRAGRILLIASYIAELESQSPAVGSERLLFLRLPRISAAAFLRGGCRGRNGGGD